jgi:ligand-binding sensor domain-containing protein
MPAKNDSAAIAGSVVYCVMLVKDDQLWMGTENGLSVLDIGDRRFLSLNKVSPALDLVSGMGLLAMTTDSKGIIWMGTENGLYRLIDQKNLEHLYPLPGNTLPADG